jgi:hypothetical protein
VAVSRHSPIATKQNVFYPHHPGGFLTQGIWDGSVIFRCHEENGKPFPNIYTVSIELDGYLFPHQDQ